MPGPQSDALDFLVAHGAERIAHPGGTLFAHLRRTAAVLGEWGASEPLVLAGLCHAAYGTDGFATSLIGIDERAQLVSLIGADAEATVYFYAACDRAHVYPLLGRDDRPLFRDRFTGEAHEVDSARLRDFVDLTVANELDVLSHSAEMLARHGAALAELFDRCRPIASAPATAAADVFFQRNPHLHDRR